MKILQLIFPLFVAIVAVHLAGCASASKTVSKPTPAPAGPVARDKPAVFESVMRTFVDRGVRGDVDGMVALTSKVTISQMGLEPLKDHYAKDIVPVLKLHPRSTEGGRVDAVDDGKGTSGWVYKRIFSGRNGDEAKLQFIVLKEQGRIGVGYVGYWK